MGGVHGTGESYALEGRGEWLESMVEVSFYALPRRSASVYDVHICLCTCIGIHIFWRVGPEHRNFTPFDLLVVE